MVFMCCLCTILALYNCIVVFYDGIYTAVVSTRYFGLTFITVQAVPWYFYLKKCYGIP